MPLDYHSLLTAFTLSGCGLAAAFLVSWLVSKKERFLMAWTIGVSLMALGVLIYAAYVTTMAPLLGAAGYTVLLIGLAFVFGAGREFRTQILPWRSMLAMAAGSSIVVAVPMLAGTMRWATAQALPPLDPPQTRSGSNGFFAAPNRALLVVVP